MVPANKDFFIIGHRGAAGEKFENSMEGFQHTLELNTSAIEIDIRQHSGQLWVIHDDELERLTGLSGRFTETADISAIRLRNGEPIPALDQVLDLYWGKQPINIEIKSINEPALLLQLLDRYPSLDSNTGFPWIVISSFDHQILIDLKQLGCHWPLAPIDEAIPDQIAETIATLEPYSWHFDDEQIDLDRLPEFAASSVRVLVYTVNSSARAKILRKHGVVGIFTDYPTTMIKELTRL